MYNLSLPLLAFCTADTLTHCYDTSADLPQVVLAKDRIIKVVFKSVQYFFASSCAKSHIQTALWAEGFKQVRSVIKYYVNGYTALL
jgi:hypothetical protein